MKCDAIGERFSWHWSDVRLCSAYSCVFFDLFIFFTVVSLPIANDIYKRCQVLTHSNIYGWIYNIYVFLHVMDLINCCECLCMPICRWNACDRCYGISVYTHINENWTRMYEHISLTFFVGLWFETVSKKEKEGANSKWMPQQRR